MVQNQIQKTVQKKKSIDVSIDDILQYIVPDKLKKPPKLPPKPSELENKVAKKHPQSIKSDKPSLLEETLSKKPESLLASVKYELFIPTNLEKYDSLEIKYQRKEGKESLSISFPDKDIALKTEKQLASPEYSLEFSYSKEKAGYVVKYQAKEYTDRIDKARQDFTNALDKSLNLLPKSVMGGVLGFTYLGSGKMTRRDDLSGSMALMVDVHETIHTPDEYETRVLTDWILKIEKPKYKGG